jgi:uncharacterized membrane-anchored protein
MRNRYLLLVLALFLAGFAFSVFRMERLRADGTDALLRLAPVDPRALLLGDYMDLDYAVGEDILEALGPARGRRSGRRMHGGEMLSGKAVVSLRDWEPDATGATGATGAPPLAVFERLDDGTPLREGEFFLAFKLRGRRLITASPAFYFQEGYAEVYERARYGRIKLDGQGRTLLVALCDANGQDMRPPLESGRAK